MDVGTPIPAGWYDDPAGSGRQRWWGGSQWTEHLQDLAPEPEPAPVIPQFASMLNYAPAPAQTYAPAPVNPFAPVEPPSYNSMEPAPYLSRGFAPARFEAPVHVDNTKGWLSLLAGVASLVLLAAGSFAGAVIFGTATAVIVAVSLGFRSLAARRSGQSTVLVPPILGIAMAVLTVAIFFFGLVYGALSSADAETDYPKPEMYFEDSPELTAMAETGYDIQHILRLQIPSEEWPSTLVPDDQGVIKYNDVVLGTILPGQTFSYATINGGSAFVFRITGSVPGETVTYNSATKVIMGCYDSCGG